MSPVVEAFINSKNSQAEANSKAQEWLLRKQQLDEMAKQFKTTSEQAQQRIALESQQQQLATKMTHLDAIDKITHLAQTGALQPQDQVGQGVQTNTGPAQFTQGPQVPNVQIPGITPGEQGGMTMPGMQNVQLPASTISRAPIPVGAPATYSIPGYEDVTMGRVPTNIEQQAALLPGQLKAAQALEDIKTKGWQDTVGNETERKLASTEAIHKSQMEMLTAINDAKMQQKDRDTAIREYLGELRGRNAVQLELMKLGYNSPQESEDIANKLVAVSATGHMDPSALHNLDPATRRVYEKKMTNLGYKNLNDKDMGALAEQAVAGIDVINSTNNFLQGNKPPNGLGAQAINWSVNKLGGNRAYKDYKATTIPTMEKALGLPLGRINGSPNILAEFEPMIAQPFETSATIGEKKERMADVVVAGLAKTLDKYNVDQRKMILRDIIQANPGIEQTPEISYRIHQFLDSGSFKPRTSLPSVLK